MFIATSMNTDHVWSMIIDIAMNTNHVWSMTIDIAMNIDRLDQWSKVKLYEHRSSMIINHKWHSSRSMIVAMKCRWSYMISVDQWVISWTLPYIDDCSFFGVLGQIDFVGCCSKFGDPQPNSLSWLLLIVHDHFLGLSPQSPNYNNYNDDDEDKMFPILMTAHFLGSSAELTLLVAAQNLGILNPILYLYYCSLLMMMMMMMIIMFG